MRQRYSLPLSALVLIALPGISPAQQHAESNELLTGLALLHDGYKKYIMDTAELVPEELYSFRPTEEVRTLGGILVHIAINNYYFCSAGAREPNPKQQGFMRTRTSKVAIIAALQESFAYCEAVYARTSDADGAEKASFQDTEYRVATILAGNTAHNADHNGNLVTYMRINGIVPPSTAAH